MDTVLWVVAGVMTTACVIGAGAQILLPKERYRDLAASQHWADDFSAGHLKAIGTIKLLGGIGLVVPPLVGFAEVLSPLAAVGLMLFMSGAATTRFRRSEWVLMASDVAFLVIFAFLAWGRLVLAPFGA